MKIEPQGPQAARLRQRKYQLLRPFPIPPDLLPGSLSLTHRRCGQPTCHCASDQGHPIWYLTFMVEGKKRVERIPRQWVEEVQRLVQGGRQFKDAVARGVCDPCAVADPVATPEGPVRGPTPRRLWRYAAQCLRLQGYLESPGEGRESPRIAARTLLWSLLIGRLRREGSFLAIEALVRSPARRALPVPTGFGDDALAYFTERLQARVTRRASADAIRQAKRNKAFDDSRFMGLAMDGTTVGRRSPQSNPCQGCRPFAKKGTVFGYRHHMAVSSVVGTGLTLPVDVEPYGPGDSEYGAALRLLRRAVGSLGVRFADYMSLTESTRGPPSCMPPANWGCASLFV